MRVLTFVLLALFSLSASAQKSPVEKFIKKNAFDDGISMTEIKPGSTDFSKTFGEEGMDLTDMLKQIDVIKVIKLDDELTSAESREDFYNKASTALDDKRYVELVNINADEESFNVYINQHDGIIKELAVMYREGPEVGMIYLKGDIDLAKLDMNPFLSAMSCGNKGKDCKKEETGGE